MEKLVSVVLPVYNGAKYLRKSIESVVSQTYKNWELLILDDCSTDETPEISKEYAEKDSRIIYHRNEKNLRLPGNLNEGFSLSKGEYLTWTSDDNAFHSSAIETMVKALEKSDVAKLVYASYDIIDENGKITGERIVESNYRDIIVGINCIGACFMYTREVYEEIGNYDTDLFLTEDFDYWQRVIAKYDAICLKEKLYYYRDHGSNLTNTMKKENFYNAYKKMLLKNIGSFGKLNIEQKSVFYSSLYKCEKELNSPNANKIKNKKTIYNFLFKFIKLYPRKIKNKIKG